MTPNYSLMCKTGGSRSALALERFQEVFPHHADYARLLKNTETLAYFIRSFTIHEMTCAALGHPGGSFSETEFLAVLFTMSCALTPKSRAGHIAMSFTCPSATPARRSTPR